MTQEEFFGRYKYDVSNDKIGIGTFGTVYKAYDTHEFQYVALKIAEVKTIGNNSFSFAGEIMKFQNLPEHPNLVNYTPVFTFPQATGTFDFAIMPYFPAGNLNDLIQKNTLSQSEKEDIALQILSGLEFLHNRNIIHGDLKPANILIDTNNQSLLTPYRVRIADFGLTKTTETEGRKSFEGKNIQYSSPEQLKGEAVNANSDLWSWAIISYKLLTDNELFVPENQSGEIQLMKNILEKDVTASLSELPENWKIALYDSLIKDPSQRIKSASGLKNILSGDVAQLSGNLPENELVEIEEDDTEEFEVEIENETDAVKPQPVQKPKNTPAAPEVKQKRKNPFWIIFMILLIPALYYVHTNYDIFGKTLSEKKAKAILIRMMEIRSAGQFGEVSEVFAEPVEKYFDLNDVSRKNIVADMEKFAKSWTFENVKIVDFGKTVENMFHFTMTYNLRDVKLHQITPYEVSGEVGFVKEGELYKISYITNRGVTSDRNSFSYSLVTTRKQQDFTDYMLTYYASVLYLPEIKDENLLQFIYSDLWNVQPAGYKKADIQKALQDDYIEFINTAEKQMIEYLSDTALTFSHQTEMTIAFVDANFLSLQVVQNKIYGSPASNVSVQYKNMDYPEGKILRLTDVLNVGSVSWPDIITNAFSSNAVTVGGKVMGENSFFLPPQAPANFYFDTKKLFLVYGVDEIPAAAQLGPVTISIPLEEIKKYLTTDFKEKIFNSSKVNVKKT